MKKSVLLLLLFSTIGCDQVSKSVVRSSLNFGSRKLIGSHFQLVHAENPGAFLSLGAGLGEALRFWILVVGVGIFLALALWVLLQNRLNRWTAISLTLIIAGGLGNLIDRVYKGTVTDFMVIQFGSLHTGIFNLADAAIMLGMAVMFLSLMRYSEAS